MADQEPIRFVDILTTASAAANYQGSPEVHAVHVIDAIRILLGEITVEDLGRPMSPLVASRMPQGGAVRPVQEIVQRWYAELGGDPSATLDARQADILINELRAVDED